MADLTPTSVYFEMSADNLRRKAESLPAGDPAVAELLKQAREGDGWAKRARRDEEVGGRVICRH